MMVQYSLVDSEVIQYLEALDRVEAMIDQRKAYLQSRVDKENISKHQLYHENQLLETIHQYIQATDQLHRAIGRMHQTFSVNQKEKSSNKFQLVELQIENKKLRAWLESYGRNPDELLPYIRIKDFR